MCNRRNIGIALITIVSMMLPVSAQRFAHRYYVRPHYYNHYYRGYAPYMGYGSPYMGYPGYTFGDMALSAGAGVVVGGLVGALAASHGFHYDN